MNIKCAISLKDLKDSEYLLKLAHFPRVCEKWNSINALNVPIKNTLKKVPKEFIFRELYSIIHLLIYKKLLSQIHLKNILLSPKKHCFKRFQTMSLGRQGII